VGSARSESGAGCTGLEQYCAAQIGQEMAADRGLSVAWRERCYSVAADSGFYGLFRRQDRRRRIRIQAAGKWRDHDRESRDETVNIRLAPTLSVALVLTACAPSGRDAGQMIQMDARNWLSIRVDGVQARGSAPGGIPRDGEPIHRVLQSADGKILFQYDLAVRRTAPNEAWHFLLKPAGSGPTFASAREVSVTSRLDTVRVELMENPATGRKVADVFTLLNVDERDAELHSASFSAHAKKFHSMLRHFIHGD
jgi:hypothetical protein